MPANLGQENIWLREAEIIPLFFFAIRTYIAKYIDCCGLGEQPLAAASGVQFAISPLADVDIGSVLSARPPSGAAEHTCAARDLMLLDFAKSDRRVDPRRAARTRRRS